MSGIGDLLGARAALGAERTGVGTGGEARSTGPVARDGLSFAKTVSAGADDELARTMNRPGAVEYVEVRIYPGPELDLELDLLVRTENGGERSLVELEGKDVIDGDDERYTWRPSHRFDQNDEIVIAYTNQDGANSYDFRVNMDIDYRGPVDRLAHALRGLV